MELSKADNAAASPSTIGAPELMGAEILVKALQAENVQYIWGYPGGAVLYIYDALYKQDTIQHVLVRHEQAAVHAAEGYARNFLIPKGLAVEATADAVNTMKLRDKAKAELGDRFDPREFHHEILKDGSMPLEILEAKIDRWIASKQN